MKKLFSGIRKRIHSGFWTGFVLACISLPVTAQNLKISGTLIDQTDKQPVIGAFVTVSDLKDSTDKLSVASDVNGKFLIAGLKRKSYKLTIQSISYARVNKIIEITGANNDLGIIPMNIDSKVLKEVVVVGQGTAVQKGDTTIMTADAFKVNPDANAEDLVKKMPGITVENGTVKAHGEDISKVLVDGKPFFGDDPSVALRNLPADVIDRVQVFNKLSDQAELTGFDDGNSSKTINIITRKNSKVSTFGKITGGTNFTENYLVAGSLNIFKGPRRLTFTGMTNNINTSNFAMQDLVGSTGGSGGGFRGGMGGGGFGGNTFFGSSGINKNTSSFGMNYTDNWGKKLAVTGSYFFNTTNNYLEQESNTEYLGIEDGNLSTNNTLSTTKNYNHRVNFRFEYTIDSMNSIIMVPRISFQENSSDNSSLYSTTGGVVNTQTLNDVASRANGAYMGNELTWRHKFLKKGRSLSVRSEINYNNRTNDNTQIAFTDSIADNLYTDGLTGSLSLQTNLSYTEPIGKYSMLQFNLRNNYNKSNTDRKTYRLGDDEVRMGMLDSLSNVFNSNYITNRGGMSYMLKKGGMNLTLGVDYQRADLNGSQTYPQEMDVKKTFESFLPSMMMTYKMSNMTNLRMFYRTNTNAPSITQLQNVIDNANRLQLSTGNPALRQEYGHNLMTNFAYANPTSGFNAFVFLRGSYTKDVIGSKTIYAQGDTLELPEYDVTLLPGGQLSHPVNLDHSYSVNSFINLAYFLKPIKSNLNFVVGGGYSQSPGFIGESLNRSNSYSLTNSLILTSNVSANLDFTFSYTSNYSIVKNTAGSALNLSDTKYWYQSASGKLNWIIWKGFVLNTDVVYQYNQGLSQSYNQEYLVWNASVGKKFLKSQAAEFKIGVYDILNQNNSISRTVTANMIRDTRTNAFQRYFLVLFTYNLRAKNQQPQEQNKNQQQEFPMPPGGMIPGGMPPGGRPGGMPGGGMPGGGMPHPPGGF